MVRLRMQRFGRTHRPFYRINAIDGRVKRDGKVLEQLGWYNPVERDESKQAEINAERVRHWLEQGARPSETVMDLLGHRDLLEGELKAEWETRRAHETRLGKCKAAAKAIQGVIAEIKSLGGSAEADPTPFSNTAKRELNNAKRTFARTEVEKAEAAQAKAAEALESFKKAERDAKSKAPAEPETTEEAAAEGGSAEG